MQIPFSSVPNQRVSLKFNEIKKFIGTTSKGFGQQTNKIYNTRAQAISMYTKLYDNVKLQFIESELFSNSGQFVQNNDSKIHVPNMQHQEFHAIVPKYKAHLQELQQLQELPQDDSEKVDMSYNKMLIRTKEIEERFLGFVENKVKKLKQLDTSQNIKPVKGMVDAKDCSIIYKKAQSPLLKGSPRPDLFPYNELPGPSDYNNVRLFEGQKKKIENKGTKQYDYLYESNKQDTSRQRSPNFNKKQNNELNDPNLDQAKKQLQKYIEPPEVNIQEDSPKQANKIGVQGTSSFKYQNDRFGNPEFPYVLRLPEPGPGAYQDNLQSLEMRMMKQKERKQQQRIVREWFDKFKSK